jgi:hypothetical protein
MVYHMQITQVLGSVHRVVWYFKPNTIFIRSVSSLWFKDEGVTTQFSRLQRGNLNEWTVISP